MKHSQKFCRSFELNAKSRLRQMKELEMDEEHEQESTVKTINQSKNSVNDILMGLDNQEALYDAAMARQMARENAFETYKAW